MSYHQALEALQERPTVEPGSPAEQAAIDRFTDFISVLSPATVRAKARQVYAEEFYFNDTLKEVRHIDELEAYFTDSLGATESTTVEVTDVARSQGDYYFRWTMDILFKNYGDGQVQRSIGMSHVRFDQQGRVVLHQDYWDSASGLFVHLPVVGRLIRLVKGRL